MKKIIIQISENIKVEMPENIDDREVMEACMIFASMWAHAQANYGKLESQKIKEVLCKACDKAIEVTRKKCDA